MGLDGRPNAQNPRPSSSHYDRRRTKVSRSLAAGRTGSVSLRSPCDVTTEHAPEQRRETPLAGRGSVLETDQYIGISRGARWRGKLVSIYYSPESTGRDWQPSKTSAAAKVIEQQAKDWLRKQAIWQIYLPAPRYIPRPKVDVSKSNKVHQADLLFLPQDREGWKTFRYALTVVAIASSYKAAEPLTSKTAAEVADALSRIYRQGPLKCAKLLQVVPRREFMGAVSQGLAKHGVEVRRGRVDIHRDQGERFNRTSMPRRCGSLRARGPRSGLSDCPQLSQLNSEDTRLTGKKPRDAIRDGRVAQKPFLPADRPFGLQEQKLPSGVGVRYLYRSGELEGGRRRATDPVWSLEVYRLGRSVTKPGEPVLYYLQDGPPHHRFVREELLVVPPDTQLPPDGALKC